MKGEEIVDKVKNVVVVSRFAMEYARKGTEEQNDKMIVLPNAIDITSFQSQSRGLIRQEIRQKYGIGDNDIVILFVGRMVKGKGALELIQAAQLLQTNRKIKFLIVGGATYNSKKQTQYVNDCFNAAKGSSDIIFVGSVPYEDIPKYYMVSDISTMLSRCDEACGLVGLESMAAGLPVITTDRGGIPEYIPRECKIVVSDDRLMVENIAKAVDLLAEDTDRRKCMGEAGLVWIKKFSKNMYYRRFTEMINKILDE